MEHDRMADELGCLEKDLAASDPVRHDHIGGLLTRRGWTPCGEGDWAVAFRSPSGRLAARVSPFDPAGPFSVQLYREGAGNAYLPRLDLHRDLDGGGHFMVMEFLEPVGRVSAAELHRRLRDPVSRRSDPALAAAAALIDLVHDRALITLPWCGPLDDNPGNVMRDRSGQIKLVDLFYLQGRVLYEKVLSAPDEVVRAIPPGARRNLFDIPAVRRNANAETLLRMRRSLESADAAAVHPGETATRRP